jgi:hypothetical protein
MVLLPPRMDVVGSQSRRGARAQRGQPYGYSAPSTFSPYEQRSVGCGAWASTHATLHDVARCNGVQWTGSKGGLRYRRTDRRSHAPVMLEESHFPQPFAQNTRAKTV